MGGYFAVEPIYGTFLCAYGDFAHLGATAESRCRRAAEAALGTRGAGANFPGSVEGLGFGGLACEPKGGSVSACRKFGAGRL